MRNRQLRRVVHEVAVEKQVEVDRPLLLAAFPPTVERVLYGAERAEQLVWREFRLHQAGAIEVGTLIERTAHRSRLTVTAHGEQFDARHEPEQLHCPV